MDWLITAKPWNLFMFVEIGVDRVHHAFWKYMDPAHHLYEPGNRFENAIIDYYKYLDGKIGRLIAKLENPDKGRLIFEGEDIATIKRKMHKAFRRKVQMIFQDPYQSLNPYLSIYDTLCEPLIIHNIGNKMIRRDKVHLAM